ncbi:MAG: primosomal protein N', partial [Holosporales bacterium]|nr:primosomal protein N' [Holosporales bacterium]
MEQKILNYNVGIRRDISELYSYSYFERIDIGQLVVVNFRNKEEIGVIINSEPSSFTGELKSVLSILPYVLPQEYISFAKFVASYNLTNFGNILKFLVPFSVNKILLPERNIKTAKIKEEHMKLNDEQKEAVSKMLKFQESFKTILLHGITGSGKTEAFLEFAKPIIQSGKQILIMVPEIALSNELSSKVSSRLGVNCYIWHNSIPPTKKLSIWKKAIEGEQICIVGARSSLFVPFKNLGCIIIDEEHDHSYKQAESTIYNARDMGIYLGSCLNIPVILSSATPAVESYNNAINGKYEYIKLKSRYFKNSSLPTVYIDDIRNRQLNGTLSEYSIDEIRKCLSFKKQALIFINRRGHTPKILCKSCGWRITCPGCSSWLCYHYETNEFVCHYCGHKTGIKTKCDNCGECSLIGIGAGVEKVSIECSALFPNAKILALSSDLINTPNKISKALNLIKNREVDLIIGTQIVSKGHNFNNINLVVITCVDSMLYGDDFRSIERAFQTI